MPEGASPVDDVARLRAEVDDLRTRLAAAEARREAVEQRLNRILGSRSYRLARRLASARRRVARVVGVRPGRT